MAPRKLQNGEKPPPEVMDLVIHLAGGQPRPTNLEIIEDVERRFKIIISARTVGRYCAEAGVPPSTLKPLLLSTSGSMDDAIISAGHGQKLLSILHDHSEPLRSVAPILRRGQALLPFWLNPVERLGRAVWEGVPFARGIVHPLSCGTDSGMELPSAAPPRRPIVGSSDAGKGNPGPGYPWR